MDPYKTAIEDRIRELIRWRRQLRTDLRFLKEYLDDDYRVELHALIRLVRPLRKADRVDDRGNHYRFAVSSVPGPDNREYLDDVRNDRELMRDELHGRDIDGSIRW